MSACRYDVIYNRDCGWRWVTKCFVDGIDLHQLVDGDPIIILVRGAGALRLVDKVADVYLIVNPFANPPHAVVIFSMVARL